MTDTSLIRPDDAIAPPARRVAWLPIAIASIALVAIAAGAGWWLLGARQSIPDWERLPEFNSAAPAGDAFAGDTPWVHFRLAPARPGDENILQVALTAPRGTPVPSSAETPRIASLTAQPLSEGATVPQVDPLPPGAGDEGWFAATSSLDRAGWWRMRVAVEGAAEPVDFYLLLPDPNLNGPNAVPGFGSSADGEAVFRRGMDAITALRTVRFTQWIADGKGNAAMSEHAVRAGGDGAPPGFTYRAAGGMEAVIIDTTRWVKLPSDLGWQQQEGATVVPPAEWDDEYFGATDFTILGEETIDGEPCQLVAFVVPQLTEPRRQTVAWYLWWVGKETGQVRQEAMVSRLHYMLNHFTDFDAPLDLAPPVEAGTPVAGTPPPAGTPGG